MIRMIEGANQTYYEGEVDREAFNNANTGTTPARGNGGGAYREMAPYVRLSSAISPSPIPSLSLFYSKHP